MYTINKILVTTDFSDFSAEAMDYALSLADLKQAELHLLHVVDEGMTGKKDNDAGALKHMKKFVAEHVDESVWIIQSIRSGNAPEEIVRYAREAGIDLIVMATHGRTGITHVIMGSIAEKVVRRSSVPVLTVKPRAVIERLVTEGDVVRELHIDEAQSRK